MLRRTICAGTLLSASACAVPGTLGLPCTLDSHCDAGQRCGGAGTCEPDGAVASTGIAASTSSATGTPQSTGDGPTTTTAGTGTSGSDPDTTSGGPTCGAAIGSCDAIDVLIVIDNSASMDDEFDALIPAFSNIAGLFEELIAGPCSYHVGITSTEIAPDYQDPSCQLRGALHASGAILGGDSCFGDPSHPPYVRETDDIGALGCLFAVGTNYAADERQIDTALGALSSELGAPGACNAGFLREDAALVVVFVTDEDDDDDSDDPLESPDRTGSPGDPTDWFDALTAIKPAERIGVLALVADSPSACPPWMPLPDDGDGTGAEYATRLLTFMQHFTGVGLADHIFAGNICASSDELMAQIGEIQALVGAVCAQ